jgi:hypothetical protein
MFDCHSEGRLCLQCGACSATYEDYEVHMESHDIACPRCKKVLKFLALLQVFRILKIFCTDPDRTGLPAIVIKNNFLNTALLLKSS